jgi:hypothetical protein
LGFEQNPNDTAPMLKVVEGPCKGLASTAIPVNSSISVGRRKQKNGGLQLSADEEASANHCVVRALDHEGRGRVEDLGSLNGTRVGKYRQQNRTVWHTELGSNESCEVLPGDAIEVGGSILIWSRPPAAAAVVTFGLAGGEQPPKSARKPRAGPLSAVKNFAAASSTPFTAKTVTKTARRARSRSPASSGGGASPVPFNFDTTPPSSEVSFEHPSTGEEAPLLHKPLGGVEYRPIVGFTVGLCAALLLMFGYARGVSGSASESNWVDLRAGARIQGVQVPDAPSSPWWAWRPQAGRGRTGLVSGQTAKFAFQGEPKSGRCWWIPPPWAQITLALPACVSPNRVRLVVLRNDSLATCSGAMLPQDVTLTSQGKLVRAIHDVSSAVQVHTSTHVDFTWEQLPAADCVKEIAFNVGSREGGKSRRALTRCDNR